MTCSQFIWRYWTCRVCVCNITHFYVEEILYNNNSTFIHLLLYLLFFLFYSEVMIHSHHVIVWCWCCRVNYSRETKCSFSFVLDLCCICFLQCSSLCGWILFWSGSDKNKLVNEPYIINTIIIKNIGTNKLIRGVMIHIRIDSCNKDL